MLGPFGQHPFVAQLGYHGPDLVGIDQFCISKDFWAVAVEKLLDAVLVFSDQGKKLFLTFQSSQGVGVGFVEQLHMTCRD